MPWSAFAPSESGSSLFIDTYTAVSIVCVRARGGPDQTAHMCRLSLDKAFAIKGLTRVAHQLVLEAYLMINLGYAFLFLHKIMLWYS